MSRVKKINSVRRAKSLYTRFSGHQAEPVGTIDIPDDDVLLIVGSLDGVLYTTVRDGETEAYVHQFKPKAKPTLAVSSDGERAYILGGNFRFTDAGFEDFKKRKNRRK